MDVESSEVSIQAKAGPATSSTRVLVGEDNVIAAKATAMALKRLDCTVDGAEESRVVTRHARDKEEQEDCLDSGTPQDIMSYQSLRAFKSLRIQYVVFYRLSSHLLYFFSEKNLGNVFIKTINLDLFTRFQNTIFKWVSSSTDELVLLLWVTRML